MAKFEDLKGKTLASVTQDGDEQIRFVTTDGHSYLMYHSQACCESVAIEDIEGDLQSLVGNPILTAEEATNDTPKTHTGGTGENAYTYTDESATWTFYKLATINGHVDIRWYGSSNGYYSERVSFRDENDANDYGG